MTTSSRLGVTLILLSVVAMDSLSRYRLAPSWTAETIFAVGVVAMLLAAVMRTEFWHRAELLALWTIAVAGLLYNAANLCNTINILAYHVVEPATLFYTGVTIWVNNVLTFTLLYWLMDRGGPDARANNRAYPDFDFPAMSDPERVRPNWQPSLVDYLFIGFTTSTAFSPTEAQPLTARAKLLMIVQSAISLATIAIVAARAVNIIQ